MVDERRRLFLRGRPGATPAAAARPPWSLTPDTRFAAACTRCGHCIDNCPRQVLRAGDGGFPVIDFSNKGCSLCGACQRACEAGAIGLPGAPRAFPWSVQVRTTCLAEHGVECRLCGDACDARALRFVPRRGGVAHLQVLANLCSGCGECVSNCPVGALEMSPAPD